MTRRRISRELLLAVTVSAAVHATWLGREAKASLGKSTSVSEVLLETEMPRPKELEPSPEPPRAATNSPAEEVRRSTPARNQSTNVKALPAAAQAAKTLTAPAEDDNAQPADFTLVQGEGIAYVGGTTSALGASRTAVRGPASDVPVTVQRSIEVQRSASLPDRSRSATPTSPAWDCSRLFPADVDAGDFATVLIAVSVGADGLARRVAMLRDPGHGFGAAAIQCAMSQRYNAALDRQGLAVAATTPPIIVRFSR
jgi:periplasmic protein TonB